MKYYYKVLDENQQEFGKEYHLGLNEDPKNKIYVNDNKESVLNDLYDYTKIAKLYIPEENYSFYENNDGLFRTNKIYIEEIHDLNKIETIEWIENEGITINWEEISIIHYLSEEFIEKYSDKLDWFYISSEQKLSENFIEKFQDKVNWSMISKKQKLSENFIEKYSDKVNWDMISFYQELNETFIEKHENKVIWDFISLRQNLSEDFLIKHINQINIYKLLNNNNISQEVYDNVRKCKNDIYYKIIDKNNIKYHLGLNTDIEENDSYLKYEKGIFFYDKKHIMDYLDIGNAIVKITIPKGNNVEQFNYTYCNKIHNKYKSKEIFIEEIHDLNKIETIKWMENEGIEVEWNRYEICQELSEEFIEEYSDKVNWKTISQYQNLSESFIEKHNNKVNWFNISYYQKLSESFIEKNSNKVNWKVIAEYQDLSKEFIIKHLDDIDIECLKYNKNISQTLFEEIKEIKESQNQELNNDIDLEIN